MGVGRRLRRANPDVKLVGVEPRLGEYLQGIRSMADQFRPPLVDLDLLDMRYLVRSADALLMMRRVVREEGVLVGVSGGACLYGAMRYAERLERGNIVVMFCDGGWKYLPARPWEDALADHQCLDDVHWW
jgi:cysteine synthase B